MKQDTDEKYKEDVEYKWRPATEKTGYKYSIKFNQSLTAGTIAFEGFFAFDDPEQFDQQNGILLTMLQVQEEIFRSQGYKVASSIPNNMRDLANRKTELQLAKEVNKLEETK